MKKLLLVVFVFILLATIVQAKDLPELSIAIEKVVAEETFPFANGRVKQMCEEWPTCMEWVNNKIQQNPSFKVVDTEVERWVKKWEDEKTIWGYRFYVQTRENGQIKTYLFKRGDKGLSYAAPVVIKKFPGHPIPSHPTEYISFYKAAHGKSSFDYYSSLCGSWPGCDKLIQDYDLARVVTSQYIYKRDVQGNAFWKRKLYIAVGFFADKIFVFRAYQTRIDGDYNYQGPTQVNLMPTLPDF